MAKKKPSKASKAVSVDFTKAQGGGGNKRYPEGDYKMKFVKWEMVTKKDKPDERGVKVTLEFLDGKYKGQTVIDRLWLQDNTLWRIRAFLEAMGVTVPNKKANVNFEKYVGKELGVTLGDNEYNNRVTSQISDYVDLDTLSGDDVDDDDEDEDDDEDDDEDEDEDEMEEFDTDDDL
jgi:hypothetical protein